MKYFARLMGYAFRRTLLRTDVFAAVATAIAPAAYFLLGQTVPDNLPLLISFLVGGLAGAAILLRILAAPYLLWRDDQATIKALREDLESPLRQEQMFFRNQFLGERAELAKHVRMFALGIRSEDDWDTHYNAAHVRGTLRPTAMLFFSNGWFDADWNLFDTHVTHAEWYGRALADLGQNMPNETEREYANLMAFHINGASVAALQIVRYLTGNLDRDTFAREYQAFLEEAEAAIATEHRQEFIKTLALLLPQPNTEAKKQQ